MEREEEEEEEKTASPKSGITKIGHDLYPPVCLCVCSPLPVANEGLVDHRVTQTLEV